MNNREETRIRLEKEIERDYKLESELRQKSLDLLAANIQEIRKLIAQISVLSATIIGILIAIGKDSELIKTKFLIVVALFILMVVISYALIYLKVTLEKDNKNLPKTSNIYLDAIADGRRVRTELLEKIISGEDNDEAYKKYTADMEIARKNLLQKSSAQATSKKIDYSLSVLIGLFISALFLILLSLINFNDVIRYIGKIFTPL